MDKRVYLVFSLVAIITISNAILSTLKIRSNRNTIYQLSNFTNPSLYRLEEFNLLVTRSQMYITNWVYLPNNKSDKDNLIQLNNVAYPGLKIKLINLSAGWSEEDVEKLGQIITQYESIISYEQKITESLVSFDDYQDPMKKFIAEEQLESDIIPRTNKIISDLRDLTLAKKQGALLMQDKMHDDNVYLLILVFSLALLIIASVMIAGVYMMKKIILPLLNIREVMLQMSRGELPEVKFKSDNSAINEIMEALKLLRLGLQRTSSFAGEIGRSNFNASFEPLSENDVMGSALLEMRDKLKKAHENDAQRNWAAEGFAEVSNILHKTTEDILVLSDEIICGLVQYVGAQQGVVYLVNDDDPKDIFIEPVSFFAPGKAHIKRKRIELNEGLVGQVIASNSRIHLQGVEDSSDFFETEISKVAVYDILIVQLFSAGRVIGALEIKSARALTPVQTEFIEKIAEPVASNILNLKTNLFTRKLLLESQIKTQELAEQDEELRQINNELMLQSRRLKLSETELMKQQEVLKKMNAELETKALLLVEQNMAIEDAHKALAFKADQLEKSSKYKSDFLANMSHELRTPLNSILILAKLLAENKTGNMLPKQVEHAGIIYKSGNDLLVIINDILDLSKIEAGKMDLRAEKVNITEVCRDMDDLYKELSVEKNISFMVIRQNDIPDSIHTDRVRLEQILKNLLSNAFKFTPQGGMVKLEISRINNSTNQKLAALGNSLISFSVSDNGIGIAGDKQSLIFEAFHQADGSITRKYGGTGLGLAISRQLTKMLGGEILLESVEGKGSVFTLVLPEGIENELHVENISVKSQLFAEKVTHASKEQNRKKESTPLFTVTRQVSHRLEGRKILLTDDDMRNIYSLTTILESEGATVIFATDGAESLKKLNENTGIDLVIMDIMMPNMDGIEAIKKLRSDPKFKKLPVIALTAKAMRSDMDACLEAGATDYIAKPADSDLLINKITALLLK